MAAPGKVLLPRTLVPANVAWKLRRLRMMSAQEVALRTRAHVRLVAWRRRSEWPPPRFVATPARGGYELPPGLDAGATMGVLGAADEMIAGRLVALGQTFSLSDVEWSLDPQSGRLAPLSFGPQLNYRDPALAGNARNTWELNRHQHLTLVALAYALSGDERYAAFVRRQLDSWLDQNPFPLGINWASPLELGLRLISWVWISRFLANSAEWNALFGASGRLWPSVYRHQWMIAALRSVGSSANNHLIGEMAGLFVSAVEWPWFAESQAWSRTAQRCLEAESERQFYPSGVNREQAFGYHVFASELLIVAALEGQRANRPFSPKFGERLRRAVEAGMAQVGANGLLPNYGDSDEGMATGLPGGGRHALERSAAVISEWLPAGRFPLCCDPCASAQLAARIQLSGLPVARARAPHTDTSTSRSVRSTAFGDAGLYLMRSSFEGEEVLVLADAGELGYLSIAAHGHADALSFTLAVGGEQVLIDPGTYAYHYDVEARAYFRSTAAHNTICVDGMDQSQEGGPFLWTSRAGTTVDEWRVLGDGALLAASHDGYMRLANPLTHKRTLTLQGESLAVDDELVGEGEHDIEWRLHVAPRCVVRLDEEECHIQGERHRLSIRLDSALRWRCLVGETRGGWASEAFNRREETTTIVGAARLAMPARLRHVVRVSR